MWKIAPKNTSANNWIFQMIWFTSAEQRSYSVDRRHSHELLDDHNKDRDHSQAYPLQWLQYGHYHMASWRHKLETRITVYLFSGQTRTESTHEHASSISSVATAIVTLHSNKDGESAFVCWCHLCPHWSEQCTCATCIHKPFEMCLLCCLS